jgi:hypothetical protein
VITVTYRNGDISVDIEVEREPAEVLEFARARLWPDVQPPAIDVKWEAMMAERQRISTAAERRKE